MGRKEILKKWLLMLILSYIIFFVLNLAASILLHKHLGMPVFTIIIWTISYTFFYFIRNYKIIFPPKQDT